MRTLTRCERYAALAEAAARNEPGARLALAAQLMLDHGPEPVSFSELAEVDVTAAETDALE